MRAFVTAAMMIDESLAMTVFIVLKTCSDPKLLIACRSLTIRKDVNSVKIVREAELVSQFNFSGIRINSRSLKKAIQSGDQVRSHRRSSLFSTSLETNLCKPADRHQHHRAASRPPLYFVRTPTVLLDHRQTVRDYFVLLVMHQKSALQ